MPTDIPALSGCRKHLIWPTAPSPLSNFDSPELFAPATEKLVALIEGGGAKLGEEKTTIESHDQQIAVKDGLLVWAGKKKYCRVKLG